MKSATAQLMEVLKIVSRNRLNKPKHMPTQYYILLLCIFKNKLESTHKVVNCLSCPLMQGLSCKFPMYLCSSLILHNHGLGITFQTRGDLMPLCKCQGVVLLHIQLRRWDEIGTTIEVSSCRVNVYIRNVII